MKTDPDKEVAAGPPAEYPASWSTRVFMNPATFDREIGAVHNDRRRGTVVEELLDKLPFPYGRAGRMISIHESMTYTKGNRP